MKTLLTTFLSLLFLCSLKSQEEYIGTVVDDQDTPLMAATVFLKNNKSVYSITDEMGQFVLTIPDASKADTIEVRYVGFDTYLLSVALIKDTKQISVQLGMNTNAFSEIVISAKAPVAEDFSVKKMDQIDIYFNPIAKGDPLNAIQMLPASTDTEESASPSLRGSTPDRSIVVVEGVPVRNPVRYNQLDGLGSFSIFGTDQLKSQWVYASNPPLVYGNSSAGLIELNLAETAWKDGFDLSVGLAQLGAKWSKNFKDESGFVSIYGNKSESFLYRKVNAGTIDNLNDFDSSDLGIRFYKNFSEKFSVSFFNLSTIESYDVSLNLFSYSDNALANQKRNFNVTKIKYGSNKSNITLNLGTDFSDAEFNFGNIISSTKRKESYGALNYRFNSNDFVIQTGINHKYSNDKFEEQLPSYYFALSTESPSSKSDTLLSQHDLQGFAYGKYYFMNFVFSAGLRWNLPLADQEFFFSHQFATRYNVNDEHSLLMSSGTYHNYNYPTSMARNLALLKSRHFSLEYQYDAEKMDASLAFFKKKEDSSESEINPFNTPFSVERDITGVEFSISRKVGKRMIVDVANTFLDVKVQEEEFSYEASNDFDYLLKLGLTYYHNDLFNFGVSFVSRPGLRYNLIEDSQNIPGFDFNVPVYGDEFNNARFNNYHNLSFTANRMFEFENDKSLILYFVLNNVLNRFNQNGVEYDASYNIQDYTHLSKRFVYFGAILSI